MGCGVQHKKIPEGSLTNKREGAQNHKSQRGPVGDPLVRESLVGASSPPAKERMLHLS